MDIKNNLNPEQFQAVTFGTGPLLIVAGAGTGKTTVITERFSWLTLSKKVPADEILALTFTEKASNEMKERIDKALPYGYFDLWISTFHSFCQKVLEAHAVDIGLPTDFKLLNQTGQWLMIQKNLELFKLDYYRPLGNPTKFVHALLRMFSRAKDETLEPKDFLSFAEDLKLNTDSGNFLSQILSKEEQETLSEKELKELATQEVLKVSEVADAYHTYQQLMLKNDALDFGDLINYTLRLFKERPKILAKYRSKFKYILVDEFQDTNWAQYELIKILAAPRNNLTVVGDDDQSIYKFRGASVSNILQFKKDFPDAKEVFLVKNYRSCQNILDLAYNFIQLNNPERLEVKLAKKGGPSKKLESQIHGMALIKYLKAETEEGEVKAVIGEMMKIKESDKESNWSDFAILVRANDHAEAFNCALSRAGIPYQYVASRGLYNKPVVLDIMAYLKLLDNYHESPAMFRVLSLPIFGFNQRELVNLNYWAKRRSLSLYQVLQQAASIDGVGEETMKKILMVTGLIEKHTILVKDKSAREIVLAFLEDSGYLKNLTKEDSLANQQAISYLNQFYKKIVDFENNVDFASVKSFVELIDLELRAGEQGSLLTEAEEGPDSVKVLTIHAAKGLEFKYVFVVNMVDRRFPTINRSDPIEIPDRLVKESIPTGDVHLQEERRLFYVACTRAKSGLYFSGAESYGGSRNKKPSKFLYEINLIEEKEKTKKKTSVEDKIKSEIKENGRQKISFGKKEYYRLPSRFSFSQLKAYETCPWQYRFAFMLRVPVGGKKEFSFGKTIHSVFQKIISRIMAKKASVQQGLFEKDEKESAKKPLGNLISLDEVYKFYDESWIGDWYETAKQKDEYFKKGKNLLKVFFEDAKDKILNPLYLEKGFNIKIKNDKKNSVYTIFGVMDRVDEIDGGLEIIDYKTGKAKDKLTLDDKEQLLIYQMAGMEVFDKPVKKLTFHYVESNVQKSFLGNPGDLDKIKEKIIFFINEIEEGDFSPTPGIMCQFCDFREICEHRAM